MNSNSFKNGLKGFVALFSVLLVAGATFAFTASKNHSVPKLRKLPPTNLYWYSVDASTNKTMSAAEYHDTKSNVVSEQDCDDTGTPICLYGSTNSAVPIGTNVGSPGSDDRINQKAQ